MEQRRAALDPVDTGSIAGRLQIPELTFSRDGRRIVAGHQRASTAGCYSAANPRLRTVRLDVAGEARNYVSGDQRITSVPLSIRRKQNRKLLTPPAGEAAALGTGGLDAPMIKTLRKAFYLWPPRRREERRLDRSLPSVRLMVALMGLLLVPHASARKVMGAAPSGACGLSKERCGVTISRAEPLGIRDGVFDPVGIC